MASKQTVATTETAYEQQIKKLQAKVRRLESKLATVTADQAEIQAQKLKAKLSEEKAKLLEKRNKELVALGRTKDEFIALTSHQLRTPATGTKQYLGMLLDGLAEPLGPRQRSYLQSAYDCNERQLRVVDDILRVAQVDLEKVILRTMPTDLHAFLREIIDAQSGKFRRSDHHIEYQQPAHALTAVIDRDRLRMALENIIDNADKYTEPGKRITIRTETKRNTIYIHIEDEGVGIDPKDFPKLFQKFSRIDNPLSIEVGGSGLGLYWSKRIIAMHGGDIEVSSRLGRGTTFTISLPSHGRVGSDERTPRTQTQKEPA